MARPFPEYKRFRTVMLPWDNTPRYGLDAMVHINGEGDSYRNWLIEALLDTCLRYPREEQIVFLHSWNEWCEGTYLEPDRKFGRIYLEQTREAVKISQEAIHLAQNSEGSVGTAAGLLKVMRAKEEGFFRVMHATRMETSHIWQDLEATRAEAGKLKEAARNLAIEVEALKAQNQNLNTSLYERERLADSLQLWSIQVQRSNGWRALQRYYRIRDLLLSIVKTERKAESQLEA